MTAAKKVVLEEYCLESKGEFPSELASNLSEKLLDDAVLAAGKTRFVLLSDGDFAHFARNACEIRQHVRIDPDSGTAVPGALFNEECVPSETLFHATISNMGGASEDNAVFSDLCNEQLIQFGGNATTGLGFCAVKLL